MDNKSIGRRITEAREESGLTRKELAERLNLAASTIGRYEHGEIDKVKMPVLNAIALELNVNPMWLIGKSTFKNTADMKKSWNEDGYSDKEKDMIKKYRALPPSGKAAVDAVLDSQYEFVKPKVEKGTEIS